MRRFLIPVCVLAQVLVLAFMAAEREYIVQFGETVYLRTAPLDPRDLFRGDFVRLNYDISTIGAGQMHGTPQDYLKEKGRKVFAVLAKGANGLASLDYATGVRPDEDLYVRGRLTHSWRWRGAVRSARVRYGIEQLFVEQGKGISIEKRRGQREGLQIPLEVEVAISASGTGVIKSYRWSRLGIRLEVLRMPQRPRNANLDELEGPLSPKLKVTLKNVDSQPLTLVNPGNNCGFEIVSVKGSRKDFVAADPTCDAIQPTDRDLIELGAEQDYSIEIDLSQPRWHVKTGDVVDEIGRIANTDRFRIVYRAPDQSVLRILPGAERVWLGSLPTRAFNAFGRLD